MGRERAGMELHTNDASAWREDICRRWLRLDFEPLDDIPFQGSIKPVFDFGGVKVVRWSHTAGRLSRSSNLVQDGADSFALLFPTGATVFIKHCGQETIVKAGEALMMRNNEPGSVQTSGTCGVLGVMINPSLQGISTSKLDAALGRPWRNSQNLVLLRSYLHWMQKNQNELTAAASSIFAQQLAALLCICADTPESKTQSANHDLAGARFRIALNYIDRNFQDANISEQHVAAAQDISVRYLQKIFEQEGTTFVSHLTSKRMHTAQSMLQSHDDGKNVIEVAFSAGYNDLSNFYRMFKRSFGETPTEMRQNWLRSNSI